VPGQQQPSGQGDTQNLLRLAFGFDHESAATTGWPDSIRAVLAGEANLLGAGRLAIKTELGSKVLVSTWTCDRMAGRQPSRRRWGPPREAAAGSEQELGL